MTGRPPTSRNMLATTFRKLSDTVRSQRLFNTPARTLAAPLVRDYLPAHSHTLEELQETLALHRGNQSRAAQALGLTVRQFGYRLRKSKPGA